MSHSEAQASPSNDTSPPPHDMGMVGDELRCRRCDTPYPKTGYTDCVVPEPAIPLLKYVGGKRQLLPEIRKYMAPPGTYGRYFEPFVGGGAVFFDLYTHPDAGPVSRKAWLCDSNAELMTTYAGVRDNVDAVIRALREYAELHDTEHYYLVRAQQPKEPHLVAARMIYLNRTCYNGLYRVNKKGGFNVPIGRYTNPTICDEKNLRAVSRVLKSAELVTGDFEQVLSNAIEGDFVYCDPPYPPTSATSDFTSYTANGFNLADHERLVVCARRLKERGVRVLLSNADLPVVRKMYEGFEMRSVQANRAINSKGGKRGAVGELLIW